jgi:hypothetical protein
MWPARASRQCTARRRLTSACILIPLFKCIKLCNGQACALILLYNPNGGSGAPAWPSKLAKLSDMGLCLLASPPGLMPTSRAGHANPTHRAILDLRREAIRDRAGYDQHPTHSVHSAQTHQLLHHPPTHHVSSPVFFCLRNCAAGLHLYLLRILARASLCGPVQPASHIKPW